jgi:hypothetical protein
MRGCIFRWSNRPRFDRVEQRNNTPVKLPVLIAMTAAALLMCASAHARSSPVATAPLFMPSPGGWENWEGDKGVLAEQGPSQPAVSPPPPAPATAPAPAPELPSSPGDAPAEDNADDSGDDFSMGDIPVVETVELTVDQARRALDAYVLVSEKYKDAELENYENLQDFVDQAPQGKDFEADIKAAGFAAVNEWNTAITTLSFALANLSDDQTADIRQQIEEIKADTGMAQDMRERMIAALSAMIPSENNKKVIEEITKDPVYGEKLKQLETDEVE